MSDMKPVYILAPYFMGDFTPSRAAVARHTWRILPPVELEGSSTRRMGEVCKILADEAASVRANGHLPVAIVGDCTFSIGMLAALQHEISDLSLVWYDAHGDFNTHETTPSGFIGGMPLAMLCGRGEQTIMQGAGAHVLPEANVILTDARDLDPGEQAALAASAITHLPDVAHLPGLSLPDRPIYVHFDCDVLRPEDMPATDYAAQGGASLAVVEASLAHLAQTGRVVAVSVSMWNPELDEADRRSEQLVLDLIERFVEQI